MSRTLLLTTGTSIANGTKALADFQRRASTWDEDTAELAAQIRERLGGYDLTSEAGLVRASAELNILRRLPAGDGDEVVLLVTDTADGRCCAEELAAVIRERFGVERVTLERIEGLQVRDAGLLRRTGLTHLTRRLVHYLDDPNRHLYGGGCVLCPNGGFKGVVPFLTILGMIYRAPVVYVFEFAETLVRLPPLPIGFATDMFERALPALRWAAAQEVFEPEGFYRRVPGFAREEEEWFASFLEVVPEAGARALASLSPLAEVLAGREGGPEARLMMSPMAARELAAISGPEAKEVMDHLRKLASPLWRSQHRDTKQTNDLHFYPRHHNPWRFAGFELDGMFHLCWFARHDEYDRRLSLPTLQRAAFPAGSFSLYEPPAPQNPQAAADDPDAGKTWTELRAERDALGGRLARMEAEMDELRRELRQARR